MAFAESKNLVQQSYDGMAPNYLAWASSRPTAVHDAYLEKLASLVPKGAKVLELGCGAGVPITQTLIRHGFNVTGVDISASQIALAKEHIPEATLIHADMMSLHFEPGSFDAIVAFYSIFHLPKEEQGEMIAKIETWLKDGGWMLFNLSTEGDKWGEWMGEKMFWSGLGVDGTRDMLSSKAGAGIRIVEDQVATERADGGLEETFHWIMGVKDIGTTAL